MGLSTSNVGSGSGTRSSSSETISNFGTAGGDGGSEPSSSLQILLIYTETVLEFLRRASLWPWLNCGHLSEFGSFRLALSCTSRSARRGKTNLGVFVLHCLAQAGRQDAARRVWGFSSCIVLPSSCQALFSKTPSPLLL
jgi:hypothetical protein